MARFDRTAEDEQAHTHIKVRPGYQIQWHYQHFSQSVVHAVIQKALDWTPSNNPLTLIERGEVHQNEGGNNSEVDVSIGLTPSSPQSVDIFCQIAY